eukprot:COSAG05_NODE_3719_length_1884_cov_151.360784_3_plen_102_part_01
MESDPTGRGQRGFLHSYAPQLLDFGNAIREGVPLTASAEHAMGEVAAIKAMYRSGEKRAWEKVWEEDSGGDGNGLPADELYDVVESACVDCPGFVGFAFLRY